MNEGGGGDEQGSSAIQINRVSGETVKELRKIRPGGRERELHPCR